MAVFGFGSTSSSTGRTTTTTTRTTTTRSGGASRAIPSFGSRKVYVGGPTVTRIGGPMTTSYVTTSASPMVTMRGPVTQTHYTTTRTVGSPLLMNTGYVQPSPLMTTTLHGQGIPMHAMPMQTMPMQTIAPMQTVGTMQTVSGVHAAQMGIAHRSELAPEIAPPQHSYSNVSSLDLNGVHCEGAIAISESMIVEAKNVFVGIAPFTLDAETLEITPEMSVVTSNPDIVFHIPELEDGQGVTLEMIREMAEISDDKEIHLGLPGQASSKASVINGKLTLKSSTSTSRVLGQLKA